MTLPTDDFWLNEGQLMFEIVFPEILNAVEEAVDEGVLAMPADLTVGIDWQLVNERVSQWAQGYTYDLIKGITATSRNDVAAAVNSWIAGDTTKKQLADSLINTFGPVRSKMIAATEITRVYAQGNQEAWKETGFVQMYQFITVGDSDVDDICQETEAAGPYPIDDSEHLPPLHINCRCYIQPIVVGESDVPATGGNYQTPEPSNPLPTYNPQALFYARDKAISEIMSIFKGAQDQAYSTEMDAMHDYVGSGYRQMNGYLRKPTIGASMTEYERNALEHKIELISDFMQRNETPWEIQVMRGRSGESAVAKGLIEVDGNLVGSVLKEDGFMSTTLNPNVATQGFSQSGGIIYNITVPKGTHYAMPLGMVDRSDPLNTVGIRHELEILFPPGSTIRVTGWHEENGQFIIDAIMEATSG